MTGAPLSEFDVIARTLRERLEVARVTVRLRPEENLPIVAEALAEGVPSLRDEQEIDQLAAATVQWVMANRRVLVNNDALREEPRTPQPMIDTYRLRAFMIAPITADGAFTGTLSVHSSFVRTWSADEVELVEEAAGRVSGIAADRQETG